MFEDRLIFNKGMAISKIEWSGTLIVEDELHWAETFGSSQNIFIYSEATVSVWGPPAITGLGNLSPGPNTNLNPIASNSIANRREQKK